LILYAIRKMMEMKRMKYLLLDVNAGVDSALALLLALSSKNAEVKGVATVSGNGSAEKAATRVFKLLKQVQAHDKIPVACGSERPIVRTNDELMGYWNEEAEGILDSLPDLDSNPSAEHAADFIISRIRESRHPMTLICTGRLTNLALALIKDRSIANKVDRVMLTGGALRVPGDVTPVSETNMHGDPEAAHLVFESGIPITMIGRDVTAETIIDNGDVSWLQLTANSVDGASQSPALAKRILVARLRAAREHSDEGGIALPAALAVAAALDPDLVRTEEHYIRIETKGKLSLGATLADLRRPTERVNASVAIHADKNRFLSAIWNAWGEGEPK
jgi:purine nucleosidase